MRTNPSIRRETIVSIGLACAETGHYKELSFKRISELMGVSRPLISYFYSLPALQKAVVKRAVERENLTVIAQALTAGDLPADVPKDLKRRALKALGSKHGIRKIH